MGLTSLDEERSGLLTPRHQLRITSHIYWRTPRGTVLLLLHPPRVIDTSLRLKADSTPCATHQRRYALTCIHRHHGYPHYGRGPAYAKGCVQLEGVRMRRRCVVRFMRVAKAAEVSAWPSLTQSSQV